MLFIEKIESLPLLIFAVIRSFWALDDVGFVHVFIQRVAMLVFLL